MGGNEARRSRIVTLGLALGLSALIAGVAPVLATNGSDGRVQAKIDATVREQLAENGAAPFVIFLKEQADVSSAHGMRDQDARGWYVYRTLKAHAARTQGPIRDLLEARGVSYRAFWVANVIMAKGDRSLIEDLAARSDVAKIESNAESNAPKSHFEGRLSVGPKRSNGASLALRHRRSGLRATPGKGS